MAYLSDHQNSRGEDEQGANETAINNQIDGSAATWPGVEHEDPYQGFSREYIEASRIVDAATPQELHELTKNLTCQPERDTAEVIVENKREMDDGKRRRTEAEAKAKEGGTGGRGGKETKREGCGWA